MDYVASQLDSFILSIWSGIIGGWMVSLNLKENSVVKRAVLTAELFFLGVTFFFIYLAWVHPEYRDFGGHMTIQIFLFIFLFVRLFRVISLR